MFEYVDVRRVLEFEEEQRATLQSLQGYHGYYVMKVRLASSPRAGTVLFTISHHFFLFHTNRKNVLIWLTTLISSSPLAAMNTSVKLTRTT